SGQAIGIVEHGGNAPSPWFEIFQLFRIEPKVEITVKIDDPLVKTEKRGANSRRKDGIEDIFDLGFGAYPGTDREEKAETGDNLAARAQRRDRRRVEHNGTKQN